MDTVGPEKESQSHGGLNSALHRNIEALESRRQRERIDAPWNDRLADVITGFTGNMRFLLLHLLA